MKKIFSFCLFLLACVATSHAQDAKAILDKASESYTRSSGISAEFLIKNTNSRNKAGAYSQTGKALIKGNKFKIESGEGTTWFDGKTQWTYVKNNNEVNVSNPDGEELAAVSPVSILNLYKSGFSLSSKGTTTDKGRSVYKIEMKPQKKNTGVNRYLILIDKQTFHISSITIDSKNGNNTTISILKYQSGLSLADKTFIFDKKEYPQAEVVDLR
jgi:outer membrane lipoprotein-sorting protein